MAGKKKMGTIKGKKNSEFRIMIFCNVPDIGLVLGIFCYILVIPCSEQPTVRLWAGIIKAIQMWKRKRDQTYIEYYIVT